MSYVNTLIIPYHIIFPTFSIHSKLTSWHITHFIASYLISRKQFLLLSYGKTNYLSFRLGNRDVNQLGLSEVPALIYTTAVTKQINQPPSSAVHYKVVVVSKMVCTELSLSMLWMLLNFVDSIAKENFGEKVGRRLSEASDRFSLPISQLLEEWIMSVRRCWPNTES